MIQLTVYGDVPLLSDRELADLVAPLGVPGDGDLRQTLSDRVEAAARHMTRFFGGPNPEDLRQYDAEYREELGRLAADPARALGATLASRGAAGARELALYAAEMQHLDPETRAGAAAIGDLAATLLERHTPSRVDAALSMGEAQVFDDLCACLRIVAPRTLDVLPSNELEGVRHPAIRFAEGFIQLVVDRARPMLPDASARVSARFDALLNKQDRALLDGIRRERQAHRLHSSWLE